MSSYIYYIFKTANVIIHVTAHFHVAPIWSSLVDIFLVAGSFHVHGPITFLLMSGLDQSNGLCLGLFSYTFDRSHNCLTFRSHKTLLCLVLRNYFIQISKKLLHAYFEQQRQDTSVLLMGYTLSVHYVDLCTSSYVVV